MRTTSGADHGRQLLTLQATRPEAVHDRLRATVADALAAADPAGEVVELLRGVLDAAGLLVDDLADELGMEVIDALDAAGVTWQQEPLA